MDCPDYIQKIAKLDTDVAELRPRMMFVADVMRWLALKRAELDSVFVNSSPTIPSVEEVENLMGASSVNLNSRLGENHELLLTRQLHPLRYRNHKPARRRRLPLLPARHDAPPRLIQGKTYGENWETPGVLDGDQDGRRAL